MHNIGIAVEGIVDVFGTGHLKLGDMISATIEAWEGGGVLNLGLSLKPLPFHAWHRCCCWEGC